MEEAVKKASVFSVDLLRLYYEHVFPYEEMYDWLSYGQKEDGDVFKHREFSFTIENDIYIRYLSFAGLSEMQKEIKRKQPHKIDIGAVYSCPPKDHNTVRANAFLPVERELVFDIDLTDYNEFLKNTPEEPLWAYGSWQLMAAAIKALDRTLRNDFGYKRLLWVFSGRRGVHCWVCDPAARALTDNQRKGLVSYLSLVNGNEASAQRVAITWPLHPFVAQMLPTLTTIFENTLLSPEGQDLFRDESSTNRVLNQIPDAKTKETVRDAFQRDPGASSKQKWAQLQSIVKKAAKDNRSYRSKSEGLEKCIPAIVILHTYARLDVNVSVHRNHLLKSPFVIHPKTGKVCVPILDVDSCEQFDPDAVPTLVTLANELNENPMDSTTGRKQTSLDPYLESFRKEFLKRVMLTEQIHAKAKAKVEEVESKPVVSMEW